VLVVDDDPSVLNLARIQLSEEGFRPITAECGEEAIRYARDERPDLAIVDLLLPDISGFDLLPVLRQGGRLPIILLTGMTRHRDRIRGFESGVDDYVSKPFNPEELTARVRAVLRRYEIPVGEEHHGEIRLGPITIDLNRRVVRRDGELILLTPSEWRLLEVLCAHQGKLLMSTEILGKAWGPEYVEDLQFLRVWVSRLRRKLEPDRAGSSVIRTYPGVGYMFGADTLDLAE
jgi:two-component system KDP operon response regulator KdpE